MQKLNLKNRKKTVELMNWWTNIWHGLQKDVWGQDTSNSSGSNTLDSEDKISIKIIF